MGKSGTDMNVCWLELLELLSVSEDGGADPFGRRSMFALLGL